MNCVANCTASSQFKRLCANLLKSRVCFCCVCANGKATADAAAFYTRVINVAQMHLNAAEREGKFVYTIN